MIDALLAYLSGPGAALLGPDGCDSLRLLKTSGSHAPGARVNFFVFRGAETHPRLVCHAARLRCGDERLRGEWQFRRALERSLPEPLRQTLPGALALQEIAGAWVLIEEAVRATPLPGPYRARFLPARRDRVADDLAAVLVWLAGFQRATRTARRPWTLEDDELHVRQPLRQHARWLGAEDLDVIERALLRRVRALHGVTVDWVAHHGDFWYGNILRRPDGVVVVDWEAGRPAAPSFADPLTFAFQYLFWRGRAEGAAPSLRLLGATHDFLRQSLGPLSENPAEIEAAFLVTLLARCQSSYVGEGVSPWLRLLTAVLREPRTMEWLRG